MIRRTAVFIRAATLLAVNLVCRAAQPIPDFRLADVNPNSERYNVQISPRDYRLQISGYYFGAAG